MTSTDQSRDWTDIAGDACSLPTVDRPLRLAEFDALFTREATAAHRVSPTAAQFELRRDPEVAGSAADLATRETDCCSFFEFGLAVSSDAVRLLVKVPPARTDVLDALMTRIGDGRAT